jgi:hypothetical protein
LHGRRKEGRKENTKGADHMHGHATPYISQSKKRAEKHTKETNEVSNETDFIDCCCCIPHAFGFQGPFEKTISQCPESLVPLANIMDLNRA